MYIFVCTQVGTLRFCGSTEFSGGLWAGVELDKPEGKNDGSVAGVHYFTCRSKHGRSYYVTLHSICWITQSPDLLTVTFLILFFVTGIFAPLSKISKQLERHKISATKMSTPIRPPRRIDLSRITSKINTGKDQMTNRS